jgi:DNA-binding response OmpR family regulator
MKKVIISENIHTFLEKEKNILSREEIMVFKAFTGEEVLKTHRLENANIIIIDLDMPGMESDKVCKLIRKDKKLRNVSIIIVCSDNKSAISRCQECGANAFITKPVKHAELIPRIIKLLHISQRKSLRVILYIAVKVHSKYEFFYANSENISSSGMLFLTDRDIKEGSKVKCTFYIGKNMVEAEGDIVRVARKEPKRYSCGMRFITLPQPAKARIEKFITNIMEGPPERS